MKKTIGLVSWVMACSLYGAWVCGPQTGRPEDPYLLIQQESADSVSVWLDRDLNRKEGRLPQGSYLAPLYSQGTRRTVKIPVSDFFPHPLEKGRLSELWLSLRDQKVPYLSDLYLMFPTPAGMPEGTALGDYACKYRH